MNPRQAELTSRATAMHSGGIQATNTATTPANFRTRGICVPSAGS